MSAPLFSRGTRPSLFGKRTRKASRPMLSDYTKTELERLWRSLEYKNEAEFLSELIEVRVHGREHVERLLLERVRRLEGSGH